MPKTPHLEFFPLKNLFNILDLFRMQVFHPHEDVLKTPIL
jgi:hypothetical protein